MANPVFIGTTRKSQPERNPLSKHIDEWQRVAEAKRNEVLGENWAQNNQNFYNLTEGTGLTPSFRPTVRTPELQTLMMREANDLSEAAPRPYVINNDSATRETQYENALQSEWR